MRVHPTFYSPFFFFLLFEGKFYEFAVF